MAVLLWFGLLSLHPFYIGITEVEYQEKSKTFQIAVKLFLDDVMSAINHNPKSVVFNPELKNSSMNNMAIKEFVLKGIELKTINDCSKLNNAKTIALNFVGWEIEEGGIWMYLEANNSCYSCLEVSNQLLCNTIREQIHIIRVTRNKKTQTDRFVCPNVRFIVKF